MVKAFNCGIVIYGLPSYTTKEILHMRFKELEISGALYFKITRARKEGADINAFVGFSNDLEASVARAELSHTKILDYAESENRVALISRNYLSNQRRGYQGQYQNNNFGNNLVISGFQEGLTSRQLDESLSQQYKDKIVSVGMNQKGTKGFVSFIDSQSAKQFQQDANNKKVNINGELCGLTFNYWQQHKPQIPKVSLYFKEFKTQFSNQEKFLEGKQEVQEHLETVLAEVKDQIESIHINLQADFNKPYAFVNFKTEEATTKAKELYIAAGEQRLFQFVDFPNSKHKGGISKNYIYIKPIRLEVTKQQLKNAIDKVISSKQAHVESIKLTTPQEKFRNYAQYAIVVLSQPNLAQALEGGIKKDSPHFSQEFLDLFYNTDLTTKNTVTNCYPYNKHKQYIQNKLQQRSSNTNSYQVQQQMGFRMWPMQMPAMGMYQPNPLMQYPQQFQMGGQMMPPMYLQQQAMQQRHKSQPQRTYNELNNQRGAYPNRPQQQRQQQQRPYRQNYIRSQPHQQQQRRYQNNNNYQQQQQQQQRNQKQEAQPKPIQKPKQLDPVQKIRENIAQFKKQDNRAQIQALGSLFYPKVMEHAKNKQLVNKIIMMLVDLETFDLTEILDILSDKNELVQRIQESEDLLAQQN